MFMLLNGNENEINKKACGGYYSLADIFIVERDYDRKRKTGGYKKHSRKSKIKKNKKYNDGE